MSAEQAVEPFMTTGDVAKAIGVCKTTLIRWIRTGLIPEPPSIQVGRVRVRMWGRADLMRALQHRERYYNWTRWSIDETEKRAKRLAAGGAQYGTSTAEPGTPQG